MVKVDSSHPELLEGEVLLMNTTEEEFRKSVWRTKRMGRVAYDVHGNPIAHPCVPFFIQRKELEDAGMPIEE